MLSVVRAARPHAEPQSARDAQKAPPPRGAAPRRAGASSERRGLLVDGGLAVGGLVLVDDALGGGLVELAAGVCGERSSPASVSPASAASRNLRTAVFSADFTDLLRSCAASFCLLRLIWDLMFATGQASTVSARDRFGVVAGHTGPDTRGKRYQRAGRAQIARLTTPRPRRAPARKRAIRCTGNRRGPAGRAVVVRYASHATDTNRQPVTCSAPSRNQGRRVPTELVEPLTDRAFGQATSGRPTARRPRHASRRRRASRPDGPARCRCGCRS